MAERTGVRPAGPVRLLTQLRSFGHCFNPVSFYYCFDEAGERLEPVVAEVTNTPWGERHAYVVGRERRGDRAGAHAASSEKVLHVSPFMGMDQRYEWRATTPGATLSVHIESHRAGDARVRRDAGAAPPPAHAALAGRVTARYPLATLRVLALIYAHALGLKLKGVRVHPHPKASSA